MVFPILDYLFPTTAAHLSAAGSLCRPLVCAINGSGVQCVRADIGKSPQSKFPRGKGVWDGGGVD